MPLYSYDYDADYDLRFAHTGEFVPVELGGHTSANAMPGDYKLGAYYNSVDTPDSLLRHQWHAGRFDWITPWLALRANLQYVINPGGTGTTANALIAGLYAQVTF